MFPFSVPFFPIETVMNYDPDDSLLDQKSLQKQHENVMIIFVFMSFNLAIRSFELCVFVDNCCLDDGLYFVS